MQEEKNPHQSARDAGNTPKLVAITGTPSHSAAALIDRHLPGLFLALGLLLGTLYAFVMPPLQIADEIMHFARAYSVSRGVCVASPDIDMPESFVKLNERFPDRLEQHGKISIQDLWLALDLPLNDRVLAGNGRPRSLAGFINQNVYHCLPYLPEAVFLNAARRAALPPLVLMYLCRIVNLAFYVWVTFLALRLLPDFRIVLFCAALMPMALHQAASVSADSTIIAVSFLFAAYVFRLAFAKKPEKLGIRRYLILAVLILFLVLSKTMICVVFLLFLIPAESFPGRRSRWLVIAAYFLLAIACAAVWQQVNQPNMQRLAEQRAAQEIDIAGNVRFMREHPVELAFIFARCAVELRYLFANLRGFVGTLGWLTVQLPSWLVCIYFALLVTAAATQTRATRFSLAVRGLVLVFAAAAVANTLAAAWAVNVPEVVIDKPLLWEQARVPMQGRYWIPIAFPMLVLFSTGRTRLSPLYFALIAAGVAVLASAVALYMVGTTYYL